MTRIVFVVILSVMRKWFFAVVFSFLAACSLPSGQRRVNAADGGKVTPQTALRFGIRAVVEGERTPETIQVAKVFQDQLALFEPCLTFRSSDLIQLQAKWTLEADGVISKVVVTRMDPPNEPFQACVLKQVKFLEFPRQPTSRKGVLTIGTFAESEEASPLQFQKQGK